MDALCAVLLLLVLALLLPGGLLGWTELLRVLGAYRQADNLDQQPRLDFDQWYTSEQDQLPL